MEVFNEAVEYLQGYGIPVVEDDQLDLEDVFDGECDNGFLSAVDSPFSPVRTESADFGDGLSEGDPEKMLERRALVLKSILSSEQQYLSELEAMLMPMKALKATACTSQPVLTNQQIRTVFFQAPELLALHREFHEGLHERLQQGDPNQGVGDLFQKVVNQLGVYRGFIDNYESAIATVRKCTQTDDRFKTLAENMMSSKDGSNCRTKYTLEALLYKPLDRVTKTTLVLHDLLKHTPEDHPDRPLLQEALRISSSFLSGVNEEVPHKKSAVTISKGTIRQLVKDGFLVDLSDGTRNLRHVFLFTDLILCAKLKAGRQPQYRFVWCLPLPGLSLIPGPACQLPPDTQCRMDQMKQKAFRLRQEIQLQRKGSRVLSSRTIDRARKKLLDCELWILSHSPSLPLELHSRCGKSHTVLLSSLYELSEWRDNVERLRGESCERVSPDLLNLTNSCFKLRTTHHPPLYSTLEDSSDLGLCGTLCVVIHRATQLQQPEIDLSIFLEVDSFGYFENKAQTRVLVGDLTPSWEEEFSLQVDGAHDLRLLCVQQPGREDSWTEDRVLGKTTVQLDAKTLLNKWKRSVVSLHQIELSLSLKYTEHSLQPPGIPSTQSSEVFNIHIETVAEREGVLVPHIVRFCAEEVERRGLEEVGIYRISGVATEVQALRTAFNTNLRDALVRLKAVDVNAVSGTLKLYLRELPEPLLPPQYFQALAAALVIADPLEKEHRLVSVLQSLPGVNRNTFLFLLEHLRRVSQNQEVNKMTAQNLATVFGPSLLRPPEEPLGDSGLCVDISQEIVVQVQVVLCYLQCINLPAPQIKLQIHSAELEEMTQQEP
ncbi:active breakpoint cluster region-related protein-like isoform X1 [Acipenser ruthenus]|uniref:active breakpoint cluster region-related protein-like isoform X1 n=1 Tax=Acipenser ruthenus TaxID=7906 RepID=UPI0027429B95|nr:active breakpoint cluster region-related protein-like isoform X1 [Acipenser ruthenus]